MSMRHTHSTRTRAKAGPRIRPACSSANGGTGRTSPTTATAQQPRRAHGRVTRTIEQTHHVQKIQPTYKHFAQLRTDTDQLKFGPNPPHVNGGPSLGGTTCSRANQKRTLSMRATVPQWIRRLAFH